MFQCVKFSMNSWTTDNQINIAIQNFTTDVSDQVNDALISMLIIVLQTCIENNP